MRRHEPGARFAVSPAANLRGGRFAVLVVFLLMLLFAGGCSLLEPPERPTIPTPPPAGSSGAVDFDSLELITNPTANIAPAVDPDIEALVNAVSQQNLVGYVQALESFGTRHTLSDTTRDDFGIGGARRWIFNELDRVGNGRLDVRFDDFPMNYNGFTSNQRNVVATLRGAGTHPGVIVLMAHYDSRSVDVADGTSLAPGANDNASGVALMIEAARLLSSRTWNQTVVFLAFSAEEQGTYGSGHYVNTVMLDGMVIDAAYNNDIVGGRPGIPQSIRVFAPPPDTSPSSDVARYMRFIGGLYLPTFTVDVQHALDRPERYGDHREFIRAGVGAVRLTESVEDRSAQHNRFDTAERIDYDYLRQVTQLNVATVANAAGAPPPLPMPTVAPMADPGAYILTWAPDPQAVGYAISFRPVDAFDYGTFRYVSAADAGNVAITGLDPAANYAISLAPLDVNGRLGLFSPEVTIGPSQ